MRLLVLGATELRGAGGGPVHVGGLRRRAVLAAGALEFGRVIPVSRLLDIVWDDNPPPQGRVALQGHIAALRRILPSALGYETLPGGYRLTGDASAVDCALFGRQVERARDAGDSEAAELLSGALDLWRGTAFADLDTLAFFQGASARLHEERIRALEAWTERELRLGRGEQTVPTLQMALQAEGHRQTLAALLMVCLKQAGRSAEALAVYESTRETLAAESGARPGPALQQALDQVLRPSGTDRAANTAAEAVRCSLPRAAPRFVPRAGPTAWLDALSKNPANLAVLTGPAGAGKTALAVNWAHSAADRYPDGLIYADLNGPGDILTSRRTLRSSRVLVILDNVRDAAQVTPFLSEAPASTTLAISRSTLAELVVEYGAAWHCLTALDSAEALDLLALSVGRDRVAAEEPAARELCELCDGLPLAVQIAGSRLAARPGWRIADLVDEFHDEYGRLQALDGAMPDGVSAALRLTRQQLTGNAESALALLALYPGSDIDAHVIAALLDLRIGAARHVLGELAAWNLLHEVRPGCFRRSSMVGSYSHGLLVEEIDTEDAKAGATRLADYYVSTIATAVRLVEGSEADDARLWLIEAVPVARDLAATATRLGLSGVADRLRGAVGGL